MSAGAIKKPATVLNTDKSNERRPSPCPSGPRPGKSRPAGQADGRRVREPSSSRGSHGANLKADSRSVGGRKVSPRHTTNL